MAFTGIQFFSAVLLTTRDVSRMTSFYRDQLGMPLEEERHGETDMHYGCELGDLHFAIHPITNFKEESLGVGSVKLAFEVFDMEDFVKTVQSRGVELLYPPRQMGPMLITAARDPDGNLIEFTQLSEGWISYLEGRRKEGHDLIARARSR